MATKDKFKQLQESGGVQGSFQDIVAQATTVAAIEKQAQAPVQERVPEPPTTPSPYVQEQRFMRLPNPQIPIQEYNLVTRYCETFTNMTRQDFVELAIIEKLWQERLMTDEEFERRKAEISSRPPRGHRKGTKTKPVAPAGD